MSLPATTPPAQAAVWLSEAEQRAWRAYLRTTELLMASLDAQLQRDAGIPHTYYVVLAMLSEAPGRTLRMSELACAANASPSRLSHAVGRLEDRGWVTRRPSPGDGRGTLATLTDAGWAFLQQQAPGHVQQVRRSLFDHLTAAEVEQLGAALSRVVQGLESEPG